MKLVFDRTIPVLGIAVDPWARLGPERWFDNYAIAAPYDWDVRGVPGAPRLLSLQRAYPEAPLPRNLKVAELLTIPEFQALISSQSESVLLPYKAIPIPDGLRHRRFLANDRTLAEKLENKVSFRQLMREDVPFPPYRIIERSELTPDVRGLELVLGGKSAVIVQDERLGGGQGTFMVHDLSTLTGALKSLEAPRSGKQLVISEFIEGASERSVQACVTRYGVFVGPLQKQIVAHPLLAHPQKGEKFCGGELGTDDEHADAYPEIRRYALLIGKRLADLGHKGIFGIDYLVESSGKVFVLEVNPRVTGMTPLVTMLYRDERDIPFYLLHILELGNYEYQMIDQEVDKPAPGSLLVMHGQQTAKAELLEAPASGLYAADDLQLKRPALHLGDDSQLLVQQSIPPGALLKPGGRVLADWPGLGPAFLVPAVALAAILFAVPRFRASRFSPAPVAGGPGGVRTR